MPKSGDFLKSLSGRMASELIGVSNRRQRKPKIGVLDVMLIVIIIISFIMLILK